jgi:glycolate oxidase FAD binding subunit
MTIADDAVLWARLRDFAAEHAVVFKAGVLPIQLSEMGRAAEAIARKHELGLAWIAHAVGILLLAYDGPPEPILRAAADLSNVAASMRGHLIVQRAPRTLRERLEVWGPVRSDLAVMQKLKQEFDPHGILNPGRFMGGI